MVVVPFVMKSQFFLLSYFFSFIFCMVVCDTSSEIRENQKFASIYMATVINKSSKGDLE